jgi:ribosomal protein L21
VAEELKRRRWTEAALASRRKGDPEKVKMAGAPAAGDDHDLEVDCSTVADGQLDARVLSGGEGKQIKVSKVRTDKH